MQFFTFRQAFLELLPEWLRAGEGGDAVYSLATMLDAYAERAWLALKARFPKAAPSDALAAISRDRKFLRGIGESEAQFADRVIPWLDEHRVRGNPWALMRQLAAYCNADVRVRTVDASGNWYTRERTGVESYLLAQTNWNWDNAAAADWSRFWVIIYPTATGEPWASSGTWGSATLWGAGMWGAPTATIGTTATRDQVADVRRIIAEWKPEGTICEWVIVAFDDASFDPTAAGQPAPGPGLWGPWAKTSGTEAVPSRLKTARYWRGATA